MSTPPFLIYGYKLSISQFLQLFGQEMRDYSPGPPDSFSFAEGNADPEEFRGTPGLRAIGEALDNGNADIVHEIFSNFVYTKYGYTLHIVFEKGDVSHFIYGHNIRGNQLAEHCSQILGSEFGTDARSKEMGDAKDDISLLVMSEIVTFPAFSLTSVMGDCALRILTHPEEFVFPEAHKKILGQAEIWIHCVKMD